MSHISISFTPIDGDDTVRISHTNIDIVEERLIIIMKEKNACVNLWSTIIDATTIMIQADTYTNHSNFIRQNEKYETISLQKNQI